MTRDANPTRPPPEPPLSESLVHERIYARSGSLGPRVPVGPGDDAALILAEPDRRVLLTVDQLIEGRHFLGPALAEPGIDGIARKAIARSVSDIAAMAGAPVWALATGALPPGAPQRLVDLLFDRMAHWAEHWRCPLVGGDVATLRSAADPVVLSVTIGADPHPARGAVLRSGARAGDALFITGRLGGSLTSGRHLSFEPRLLEARWLAETLGHALHAMIDLSDGLGRDAARLARASAVQARLHESLIPLHPDAGPSALSDGEDYELLFAVPPETSLPAACPITATPITRIGACTPGHGCLLIRPDGRELDASALGWDHR
ncbi:MAG: thiamine-monophosphate kinase [Phycisphaerales bacterium]